MGQVDVKHALTQTRREMRLWMYARMHENVPAFSGGLMDSWPAWAVDAIAVARAETQAIAAFLNSRER